MNNCTILLLVFAYCKYSHYFCFSLTGKLMYYLKKLLNIAAVSVSTSLSVGVFFIQFLDWWYANDTGHTSLTSLPVPDPPQVSICITRHMYNLFYVTGMRLYVVAARYCVEGMWELGCGHDIFNLGIRVHVEKMSASPLSFLVIV